jgi:hypothetical protein
MTGFEPATSGATVRRSAKLSYIHRTAGKRNSIKRSGAGTTGGCAQGPRFPDGQGRKTCSAPALPYPTRPGPARPYFGTIVPSLDTGPGAEFRYVPGLSTIWSNSTPSSRTWIRRVCAPLVANVTVVACDSQ